MENRLKERLTGAAILVALIVLVVPELFRGPRHPSHPDPSASGGVPERTYTIDLNSPPEGRGSAPAHTPTTPAEASRPAPAPAPAAHPPAPLRVAPGPTTAASAPAASAAASVKHVTPGKSAGGNGAWTVQLGLFSKPANAQRLLARAQAKGFSAHVSRTGSRTLYRVAIGGLADRSAAERLARRLHAAGLPSAIMRSR